MARRIAAGDMAGASAAQNRAVEFTLLLALPCLAAFLTVPDLIMRALFMRGAFTAADADAAGATLAAYAIGLLPFVLIRTATATFYARGDTATPVKAALTAAVVNIAFKFALMGPLAQVGLALATAIGAWINLGLVLWFAKRAGLLAIDARLRGAAIRLIAATIILAAVLWVLHVPVMQWFAGRPSLRDIGALATLVVAGGIAYGGALLLLFGPTRLRNWGRKLGRGRPPTG
jgi:putative peptidoglycan lipid II flippase